MRKIILFSVLAFTATIAAHSLPPVAMQSFEPTAPNTQKNASLATNNVVDLLADVKPQGTEAGATFTYTLPAPAEISTLKIFPQYENGEINGYFIESTTDGEKWQTLVDNTANSITADANGFTHTFNPQTIKALRVSFNGKLPIGKTLLTKLQLFAPQKADKIVGMIGNTQQRYLPTDNLPHTDSTQTSNAQAITLTAWRGERVNVQLLLQTPTDGQTLRVLSNTVFSAQHRAKNNPEILAKPTPKITLAANFVKNVLATPKLDNGKNGELTRFPDIIENSLTEVPTVAGETRTLWVTIDIAPDAVAGEYAALIKVGTNNDDARVFQITINVLNAALPAPKAWRVLLDLWQTPEAVAHAHNVDLWSDEHFVIMLPHYRRLANAGQKNITATIIHEAWGHQAYHSQPGMVRWIKNANGEMEYDFSIFDKWVEFMTKQVGINGNIVCYTMIPWSLAFRYFDEKMGADVDVKLSPSAPEYEKLWGDFLTAFVTHLREKNWLSRTRIGMDERPDNLMLPAIAVAKKYAPELKIVSAVNHATDKTQDIVELAPALSQVDKSMPVIAQRRRAGLPTMFYVCVNPLRPNTFTFSPLAQAEWLGNYAAANRLDGFLRWAYDNFNEAPLFCTDYTKWPSGDCFLVYPGARSSLRFERLRDGLENFEKIAILRDAAVAQNKPEVIAPLENFLQATYTWERGQRADNPYAADNEQTEKLINTAAKILFP